jgi:predicted xylose isomerase-like sugar epimerase
MWGFFMTYRYSRLDSLALQKQFEEALALAMNQMGVGYSEALELVFTPVTDLDGLSVADFVRRGQLPQAKKALALLIDNHRRSGAVRPVGQTQRRA